MAYSEAFLAMFKIAIGTVAVDFGFPLLLS